MLVLVAILKIYANFHLTKGGAVIYKVFVLMLSLLTILTGSLEPRAQNGRVSALFATIKLCPWAAFRKWVSSCGGHGQEIKS